MKANRSQPSCIESSSAEVVSQHQQNQSDALGKLKGQIDKAAKFRDAQREMRRSQDEALNALPEVITPPTEAGFPSRDLRDVFAKFAPADPTFPQIAQNGPGIDSGGLGDCHPSPVAQDGTEGGRGPLERAGASERPEASEDGPAPEGPVSSMDLILESKWWKGQKTPIRVKKEGSESSGENGREKRGSKTRSKLPPLERAIERASYSKIYGRDIVEELLRRGIARPAERLQECSTWVEFREFEESGNVRLRNANFCNQGRLCPGCAAAKSRKQLQQVLEKAMKVYQDNPKALPFMITLTVPNGEELGPRVSHLLNCLNRVRQGIKDYRRGRGSLREFSRIDAAVWNVEIKRGKNAELWHPHVHGLVFASQFADVRRWKFFDLERLSEEWSGISGGKHCADVKLTDYGKEAAVRKLGPSDLANDEQLAMTFVHDVKEITKYAIKFEDQLSPSDAVDAWQVTFRKRLMRTWGGFQGIKLDPSPEDYTIEPGAFVDHLLHWFGSRYGTVRQVRGVQNADEQLQT